ncbi:MAG TPA: glutamyl-tRNA reductase [Candidatus Deferrimicrobium sp.]|nr:glutamyl-tRNA reductase [Candidatus Deferrimicrobium sp.]
MFILTVGLNHKSAPVEIREKLNFPAHAQPEALTKLGNYPAIKGCVILSTCNRTEVYAATTDVDAGMAAIKNFLCNYGELNEGQVYEYLYIHTLYEAVRHLFRVSSGLDSMVLGETQILGQVSDAYRIACDNGITNKVLNTLFQNAINVGKRVRTETGIDRQAVSISYAAVELSKQIFGSLQGKSILLLGAGEMSELTAKHMVANGVSKVLVSNRSIERAEIMAEQFGGRAIPFDEFFAAMCEADIVISATAARDFIINPEQMEQVMQACPGRTVFMIDIAVPRDINPEVGKVPGVKVYDIDDLQHVVDKNLAERQLAAIQCEKIIGEEMSAFLKWHNSLFVVPTLVALKERGNTIKEVELERALARLGTLTDKQQKVISSLANSIVNQLLHEPITNLKEYAATHQGHLYTEILQNLFNLEVEGQAARHPIHAEKQDNKVTRQ